MTLTQTPPQGGEVLTTSSGWYQPYPGNSILQYYWFNDYSVTITAADGWYIDKIIEKTVYGDGASYSYERSVKAPSFSTKYTDQEYRNLENYSPSTNYYYEIHVIFAQKDLKFYFDVVYVNGNLGVETLDVSSDFFLNDVQVSPRQYYQIAPESSNKFASPESVVAMIDGGSEELQFSCIKRLDKNYGSYVDESRNPVFTFSAVSSKVGLSEVTIDYILMRVFYVRIRKRTGKILRNSNGVILRGGNTKILRDE